MSRRTPSPATRRTVVTGVAALGAGVVAGCSSDEPPTTPVPDDSGDGSASESPTASGDGSGDNGGNGDGGGTGGTAVATTDEVPEGSGLVVADDELVVTQPTAGEFKGFSSLCTHAGCPVTEVTDTINCACHGSRFSVTDGSVVGGPARVGLPAKEIRVDGTQIFLT